VSAAVRTPCRPSGLAESGHHYHVTAGPCMPSSKRPVKSYYFSTCTEFYSQSVLHSHYSPRYSTRVNTSADEIMRACITFPCRQKDVTLLVGGIE